MLTLDTLPSLTDLADAFLASAAEDTTRVDPRSEPYREDYRGSSIMVRQVINRHGTTYTATISREGFHAKLTRFPWMVDALSAARHLVDGSSRLQV